MTLQWSTPCLLQRADYTGPANAKITDEGFGYDERGLSSDIYESTPHSGGFYHVHNTFWANGSINVLMEGQTNSQGLPTITYSADGEGRPGIVSASSGTSPVTSTSYNNSGKVTAVNFGSGDIATFTYDPNTGQMTQYKETINGTAVFGNLVWSPNGTLRTLAITDPFNAADVQTCTYGYDDLTSFKAACGTPWAQTFSYDVYGPKEVGFTLESHLSRS